MRNGSRQSVTKPLAQRLKEKSHPHKPMSHHDTSCCRSLVAVASSSDAVVVVTGAGKLYLVEELLTDGGAVRTGKDSVDESLRGQTKSINGLTARA